MLNWGTQTKYGAFEITGASEGQPKTLGQGSFGATLEAVRVDTVGGQEIKEYVAIKVLDPALLTRKSSRVQFLHELVALTAFKHPNLIHYIACGEQEGEVYYAMELCRGGDLRGLIRRYGPLSEKVAALIGLQVAAGLRELHQRHQLIHRDLKPSNIMLVDELEPDLPREHLALHLEQQANVCRIVDFGLVDFAMKAEGAPRRFVGSPMYASPEQILQEPMDFRTDLYSLGMTLWHLILGKGPFLDAAGEPLGPDEAMDRHTNPEEHEPHLPSRLSPEFRQLLAKLLAKHAEQRFATAAEVQTALRTFLACPSAQREDWGPESAAPPLPAKDANGHFPETSAPTVPASEATAMEQPAAPEPKAEKETELGPRPASPTPSETSHPGATLRVHPRPGVVQDREPEPSAPSATRTPQVDHDLGAEATREIPPTIPLIGPIPQPKLVHHPSAEATQELPILEPSAPLPPSPSAPAVVIHDVSAVALAEPTPRSLPVPPESPAEATIDLPRLEDLPTASRPLPADATVEAPPPLESPWKSPSPITSKPISEPPPENPPEPPKASAPEPEPSGAPLPPALPVAGDRPTPVPPAPASEPALDDNVQFTVFRPQTLIPEKWHSLLVFAHLAEKSPEALSTDPEPSEEVQRQAAEILGPLLENYKELSQDSCHGIPHAGILTFIPVIPGLEINPPERSFTWCEAVHREEFRIRAHAARLGETLRGRLTVYLGGVILAEIALALRVEALAPRDQPLREAVSVKPYRKIFASYSHRDGAVVEQFEKFAETVGDRYLRDAINLRSGQQWRDELRTLIDEADVFQLFWSSNSMSSRNVREEWEYALSLGRANFVRPTYWESPMPKAPERGLPTEELRRLHFQRISLPASAEASQGTVPPPEPPPPPPPLPVAAPASVAISPAPVALPPQLPPVPATEIQRPPRRASLLRSLVPWIAALAVASSGWIACWLMLHSSRPNDELQKLEAVPQKSSVALPPPAPAPTPSAPVPLPATVEASHATFALELTIDGWNQPESPNNLRWNYRTKDYSISGTANAEGEGKTFHVTFEAPPETRGEEACTVELTLPGWTSLKCLFKRDADGNFGLESHPTLHRPSGNGSVNPAFIPH